MKNRDLKLKAKNFWRKHEKLILLIAGAFIIGLMLASFNYWQHQNSINKFYTDEPQIISNNEHAEFSFVLEQPSLAQNTQIEMVFENIESGTPVVIYLNDEQMSESSSNQETIRPSAEELEEENTVTIEREEIGFVDQRLLEASVTSSTNLQQIMFVLANLTSLMLVAAPIMYIKYNQYVRKKKMEEKFPEFLRDVVEGTRAGMSLPQAIQNTQTGSYGPLDEKIEKMDAQLDWGIPFDQVLKNFAKDTGSDVITRSVDTIIQAYQSGGNIQDVLESVGENIRTIKNLKEQRESQLYGEMVTGYLVYFIFIGILIALNNYLLPNLASAQESLGGADQFSAFGGGADLQENIELYNIWFRRLVFIQGFFSGLIIGKLSEGELKAGLKHTAILFALGYLSVTFFL